MLRTSTRLSVLITTHLLIDHEIISTVILLPVREVLVNCLYKLAQEIVGLDELTFPP